MAKKPTLSTKPISLNLTVIGIDEYQDALNGVIDAFNALKDAANDLKEATDNLDKVSIQIIRE